MNKCDKRELGYCSMNLALQDKTIHGVAYQVYVLPKNTTIYRGDTRLYNDGNKPQGTPEKNASEPKVDTFLKDHNFFTMFLEEAEIYGVPYQYTTKDKYNLLAIDKHSENNTFFKNAPDNIKTILKNNYGWETNKRDSDGDEDQEVADYICSLGLDGYASQPMESISGRSDLPSEIMLCNSHEKIGSPTQVTMHNTTIQSHLDKYDVRFAAERVGTKTVPGSPPGSPSPGFTPRSMNFGSPGSPSPGFTPRSMNFGSPGSPSPETTPNGNGIDAVPFAGFGPPSPETKLKEGGKRTNKKRKTKKSKKTKRKPHKKRKSNKKRKSKK